MKIWVGIFARGGSKGIPGKNLRPLGGIPLVGHSVRVGLQVPGVCGVICSTDSLEIMACAREHGAEVPFRRPPELSEDDSPEIHSWKHLANYLVERGCSPEDVLVSLPPTSPLREVGDVEAAICKFLSSEADMVISYTPATISPWFNMVVEDEDGRIRPLLRRKDTNIVRRQDAPIVHNLVTVVYVTSLRYVLAADGLFDGKVVGVKIPPERAVDIDTELDFQLASVLFESKKKN